MCNGKSQEHCQAGSPQELRLRASKARRERAPAPEALLTLWFRFGDSIASPLMWLGGVGCVGQSEDEVLLISWIVADVVTGSRPTAKRV